MSEPRRGAPRLPLLALAALVVVGAGALLYHVTGRGPFAEPAWTVPGGRAQGVVRAVAFSPDGTTLATVGTSFTKDRSAQVGTGNVTNTVDLWEVATHSRLATLRCASAPLFLGPSVSAIAFSPDGRTLAVAGTCAGQDNGHRWGVQLWDTTTHRLVTTLYDPSDTGDSFATFFSLSFSPDGRLLAGGGGLGPGHITLWSPTDRRFVADLDVDSGFNPIYSVTFSPDGQTLASATHGPGSVPAGNAVQLWDVRSHRLLGIQPHREPRAVAFSPDGRTLAVAEPDDTVRLWDVRNRDFGRRQPDASLVSQRPTKLAALTGAAFSPDGRILAASDFAGTVTLWDVADRTVVTTLSCHCAARDLGFLTVAFSRDGDRVAAGGIDALVDVWHR